MLIDALAYVGIHSNRLDDWATFGTDIFGFQLAERTSTTLRFRLDDLAQRLIVVDSNAEQTCVYGWQVADHAALRSLAEKLDAADVHAVPMDAPTLEQRRVAGGLKFKDPAGNTLEAVFGADTDAEPFAPGRTMSGFRTGALGLGHAVLGVTDIDAVLPFYTGLLEFRISDWMRSPFRGYFLHVNPRHHSLGLFQLSSNQCHHVMVETLSLDDVGQSYDLAQTQPGTVNVTLGRHINDFVTSYYANSPSGFLFECGWGGRAIDLTDWNAHELTHGASFWGHERAWQTAEMRVQAREQRLRAARDGLRQPVQVLPGNYTVGPGTCPWWKSAKT